MPHAWNWTRDEKLSAFVVRLVLFVTKLSELICPGLNVGSSGSIHVMSNRIYGIDTVRDMGVQIL